MRPRARDLGIPFEGTPGRGNAITDVPGVEVGQLTVRPPATVPPERRHWVRTGVTTVFPRGLARLEPVFAGASILNGNGEMTGLAWLAESGELGGPLVMTNTDTVGLVRDAVVRWLRARGVHGVTWSLPLVGEIWDGYLHDVAGRHLTEAHVQEALEAARGGTVDEGGVGGGSAAIAYEFKGGIGTASRVLSAPGDYRVGVLVQANHGERDQLVIAGVPVGRALGGGSRPETGSIVVFLATDAPLLPHQLTRLARRAGLGLARTGSVSGNGSGDFCVAFSTSEALASPSSGPVRPARFLDHDALDPLFEATVQGVEEAVVNALCAGETTVGYAEHRVEGLPTDRVVELLRRHSRLVVR